MHPRPSRRRLLTLAALTVTGPLAGCADGGTGGDGSGDGDESGDGGDSDESEDGGEGGGDGAGGDGDGDATGTEGSSDDATAGGEAGSDETGSDDADGASGGGDDSDAGDSDDSGDSTPDSSENLDLREANVVGVEVTAEGGSYRFDVTLHHDDDGEEGYANWWQVERLDGARLGRRDLLHPHSRQPFTRSASIDVPGDVTCVVVRGHDQTHGYGGRAMLVDLDSGARTAVDQGPDKRSFGQSDCP